MPDPDLSEFLSYTKKKRSPCPVAAVLASIEGEQKAALKAALDAEKAVINNAAIEKWLAARDITVSAQRIATHRNGKCACHAS